MKIELKPSVAELIEDHEDPSEFVSMLVLAYLEGELISKSDVRAVVHLDKVYRPSHLMGKDVYDMVTHQFRGVRVEGREESESLFIPSAKLHDLLSDHTVVMVMKNRRDKNSEIPVDSDMTFVAVEKESMP